MRLGPDPKFASTLPGCDESQRRCIENSPEVLLRALAPELFSLSPVMMPDEFGGPKRTKLRITNPPRSHMANKEASVAELTDKFRDSTAVLLTEYRGLTVAQLKTLRTTLSEHATYAVVKNTLTKIAANNAGISSFDEDLIGPSAIAFVHGDPVTVAKGLRDFAKANPLLVIKGGYFDGNPLTPAEVIKLADLESREVLLGKLAGAFKASLFGAAYMFNAPLAKAVRTVDALREKQDSAV
jgi:large subunit ribosomal protein L10